MRLHFNAYEKDGDETKTKNKSRGKKEERRNGVTKLLTLLFLRLIKIAQRERNEVGWNNFELFNSNGGEYVEFKCWSLYTARFEYR